MEIYDPVGVGIDDFLEVASLVGYDPAWVQHGIGRASRSDMTLSGSSRSTPKGSNIILAKKTTLSLTSKRSYLIVGEKNNGKKKSH